MPLTTHERSNTTALRPARFMAIAAASPQGPAPTMATSVEGVIAPIASPRPDDLVAPRAHAHVRDRRVGERLDTLEIAARAARQVGERPRRRRGAPPPFEPLGAGPNALQRHEVARKLVVEL